MADRGDQEDNDLQDKTAESREKAVLPHAQLGQSGPPIKEPPQEDFSVSRVQLGQ